MSLKRWRTARCCGSNRRRCRHVEAGYIWISKYSQHSRWARSWPKTTCSCWNLGVGGHSSPSFTSPAHYRNAFSSYALPLLCLPRSVEHPPGVPYIPPISIRSPNDTHGSLLHGGQSQVPDFDLPGGAVYKYVVTLEVAMYNRWCVAMHVQQT